MKKSANNINLCYTFIVHTKTMLLKYSLIKVIFCLFVCINLLSIFVKADNINNKDDSYIFKSNQHLYLTQGNFLIWYQQCLKNNYVSCGLLGRAYYEGYGVLPDMIQAYKYFTIGCKNNIIESCLYLSNFSQNSKKEYDISIYKQACELGHIPSCNKAKDILLDSIVKDSSNETKQQVYESLQKICNIQKEDACIIAQEFAVKFMDNDINILNKLFQDRLKQCRENQEEYESDLHVCGDVGIMYSNGIGTNKDKEEAKKYFHIACLKHGEFCLDEIFDSILN